MLIVFAVISTSVSLAVASLQIYMALIVIKCGRDYIKTRGI